MPQVKSYVKGITNFSFVQFKIPRKLIPRISHANSKVKQAQAQDQGKPSQAQAKGKGRARPRARPRASQGKGFVLFSFFLFFFILLYLTYICLLFDFYLVYFSFLFRAQKNHLLRGGKNVFFFVQFNQGKFVFPFSRKECFQSLRLARLLFYPMALELKNGAWLARILPLVPL